MSHIGLRAAVRRTSDELERISLAVRQDIEPDASLIDAFPVQRILERQTTLYLSGRNLELRATVKESMPRWRWASSWIEETGVARMAFHPTAYREITEGVARSRWTLGHELGHVVLHTAELADAAMDFHGGDGLETLEREWSYEGQANLFARHLLMPDAGLDLLERDGADLSPFALALRFGVSPKSAEIRRQERGWG